MSTPPTEQRFMNDDIAWLRDLERGPQLRQWLQERRRRYDDVRTKWESLRQSLHASAQDLLPKLTETPVWKVANRTFWWRWEPDQDFPRLWMTDGGSERVVLDVGSLTDTGFVRLGDVAVSPDGSRLAWTVDVVGDEAYELWITNLWDSDEQASLVSSRCYYGLEWSSDSQHVLFVVHDHADRPFQVWCHELIAETTRLVYEEKDERFHLALRSAGNSRWAVLRAASRLTAEEWLLALDDQDHSPTATRGRTEGVDYTVEPVELSGEIMLAISKQTSDSGYTVMLEPRTDTVTDTDADTGTGARRVLLEEAPTRRPLALLVVNKYLLVEGRENGHAVIWCIDLTSGAVTAQQTAVPGTSLRLAAYDAGPGRVLVENVAWTSPMWWNEFDLATGEVQSHPTAGSESPFADDLIVESMSVVARDGVNIPVTLLRRADVPLDGSAPCLLYGYGAWETVISPDFDPVRLALVRMGVVYVHAHIRGGGELGRDWWLQGRTDRKLTTFHDFIDVASALAEGLVDPQRIVAQGLSAGGLLVGATFAMAPELFVGVLAEAPFVDPVTTMSDATQPLVLVERDEWGDPRRKPDLTWMNSWAPLQNLPDPHRRPRLLVTSALHDPRVSVWEPARWVARLDPDQSDDRVLLRVDLGSRGHWSPPGRLQFVEYRSEMLAWVADTLGLSEQNIDRGDIGGDRG